MADTSLSGELLPPVRESVREVGFGGPSASALGRAGAVAKAERRELLRAQVEELFSGVTQEVARFALAMIQEGIDELDRARAAGEHPDKDVMRRSERAVDRWFDRILGKPTQSMTVESKQDVFVLLAQVVKGVADAG